MSKYDYDLSKKISVGIELGGSDPSFNSLLMATMRRADTINTEKLKFAFPEVWEELDRRYNAPAGWLKTDVDHPFVEDPFRGQGSFCMVCGEQKNPKSLAPQTH